MARLKNIKAVFFDFDNTLYAYKPASTAGIKAAYKLLASRYNVTFQEFMQEYQVVQAINQKIHKGTAASHNRLLRFQRLLERHGIFQPAFALALEKTYWDAYMKEMYFDPSVADTLQYLRQQGYALGIITDLTARIQLTKLVRSKISHFFGAIVTSEEAGHEKPHRAPFVTALTKLGVSAEHAVMVGDNPKSDIYGAKRMGMKTIQLIRPDMKHIKGPKADVTITKLSQLLLYL
ncbi:MAG TPA: TIGR02253 family HAD-type hydrolase [Acidobacteriota bacterium]|nr:TIGR02253 family HAD-type hydrolase [Acidobacteriota bacterium]